MRDDVDKFEKIYKAAEGIIQWWDEKGSVILDSGKFLENDIVKEFVGEQCDISLDVFRTLSLIDQDKALDIAFPNSDTIWSF